MNYSIERHSAGFRFPVDAEHWHRYVFASQFVENASVLDIACGEGYGSAFLSQKAAGVIGIDASDEIIKYASGKYGRSNLEFRKGLLEKIPLPDSSVDVITCFESIEHTVNQDESILELKRVMKEDGILIISTPDKSQYSDNRGYQNPFHVKELYWDQFNELLNKQFPHTTFYGQRFYSGSFIHPVKNSSLTSVKYQIVNNQIVARDMADESMYWIAIASTKELSALSGTLFEITDDWGKALDEERRKIYQSASYKIGNFFVRALSLFSKK